MTFRLFFSVYACEYTDMRRLSELKGDKVHTRTIEMSTVEVDETHILCSGRLTDVRHFRSFEITNASFDAGTLHDMEILILLKVPELVIEDIEARVNKGPREDCQGLGHSLDPVVGLSIARGFTKNVRKLVGGVEGCTHLVHLLTAMAPAILQGNWAREDRRPASGKEAAMKRAESTARFLGDSCYTWRRDGPAFRELKDVAEQGERL